MRRKHSGFTLIELMVVVVVLAILAGVAIPNFKIIIDKNKLRDATGPLFSALSLARTEAVKLAGKVDVCTRNTAGTDCDLSLSWDDGGWIAGERSPTQDPPSGSPSDPHLLSDGIIRLQDAAATAVDVASISTLNLRKISFQPSGLVRFYNSGNVLISGVSEQVFTWQSECWSQLLTISLTGKPSLTAPARRPGTC
jgi:prepilin-type N-terminal cleavage/methylation domain-containing protein